MYPFINVLLYIIANLLNSTANLCYVVFTPRFLMNPEKDVDIRKWASEGLAYLTLDADVKHDLCNDTDAINSLLDLAKVVS